MADQKSLRKYKFSEKYDAAHAKAYFEISLRAPEMAQRIGDAFCCSASDTGLPDNYVENVFCNWQGRGSHPHAERICARQFRSGHLILVG